MSNELTHDERQRLQYWLRTRMSIRKIAKVMRRNHTVLSREIQRNGGGDRKRYRADIAQRRHEKRRHQQRAGKLDRHPGLRSYVEDKLLEDWSPEQIAGRLKSCPPPELVGQTISHESIYHHIYEKAEKHKQLHRHLRTHRSKRQKYWKRKSRNTPIPERISIHERPETIDARKRYGDWESDTVEFIRKHGPPALSVQYERKSQLTRIHAMANKTSEETEQAISKTIDTLPEWMFKSMTFDNGGEGACHVLFRDRLAGFETYFCDSYRSWQKGGVENANKLIRQYLPRTKALATITDDELQAIEDRLNNRPRKSLKYRTPNEVIQKVVHA